MEDRIKKIFAKALKLEESRITGETSVDNTSEWDSLAMVTIISGIEEEFKVELSFDEIQNFISVKEVKRILKEKGVYHD